VNPVALLLDFDGVILESNEARTEGFRRLFAGHEASAVAELLRYHRENGGLSRYRKIEHFHRRILGREIAPEERDRLAREFSRHVVDLVLASPFVPGARALIEGARVPLVVVSGSDQDELRSICSRLGIARFFAEILGSPRSKGELIADLLRRTGWDRSRLAFVGDSRNDLDAAREHGIPFIARAPGGADWVPAGTARVDDLRAVELALAAL
jgi:phosphoglycolate phosphatase-like HAD superfamily hydrolase